LLHVRSYRFHREVNGATANDGAVTMRNWYELKLTVRGSRNGQDLSVNYGDVLGSL
jgi:hypothetical protein